MPDQFQIGSFIKLKAAYAKPYNAIADHVLQIRQIDVRRRYARTDAYLVTANYDEATWLSLDLFDLVPPQEFKLSFGAPLSDPDAAIEAATAIAKTAGVAVEIVHVET